MTQLTINIDGGSRGNPGPAAYAFVIARDGQSPVEGYDTIGDATNNVAEYTALVRALERAAQLGAKQVHIKSDSELLVKQMNGEYRVKNEDLKAHFEHAKKLERSFDRVSYQHVYRDQNKRADELCNLALDGGKPKSAAKSSNKTSASKKRKAPEQVRAEAIECLASAAMAWSRGNARQPPPEQVWDQLWSVLEENGVV